MPNPARPRWRISARAAIIAACVGSAVVHAGLVVLLVQIRLAAPRPQLIDAPATQLTLAPLTPPAAPVEPKPAPPPPPAPEATPPTDPLLASMTTVPDVPHPTPATQAARPNPKPAAAQAPATTPSPPAVASFAGVEGVRAKRIVYVMDGSAAMVTTLPFIEDELVRSVARLNASQSFQVVVFRDPPESRSGKALPALEKFSPEGLTAANTAARQHVSTWIQSIRPLGSSVPLEGLREALGLHPDLIFLLTCSIQRSEAGTWGEGNAATLAALDRLNPPDASGRRPTVIKAVQLLADDPTGLLQAIATIHGDGAGSYRVLTLDELKGP